MQFTNHDYGWGGDYLQRMLHAKRAVVENNDSIDANTYLVLSAFARGVNEDISEHRSQIPAWIDPITPQDVEALERSNYLRFYSVGDAFQKIQQKAYKFPRFGSNQWAISPFRSANGRVIHVEHTHMPWDNRFQNYEAHLIVPGKLDVAESVGLAARFSWMASTIESRGPPRGIPLTFPTSISRRSIQMARCNTCLKESGIPFASKRKHST
jgi:acyl-homoserine lactone acylase PvdQ